MNANTITASTSTNPAVVDTNAPVTTIGSIIGFAETIKEFSVEHKEAAITAVATASVMAAAWGATNFWNKRKDAKVQASRANTKLVVEASGRMFLIEMIAAAVGPRQQDAKDIAAKWNLLSKDMMDRAANNKLTEADIKFANEILTAFA